MFRGVSPKRVFKQRITVEVAFGNEDFVFFAARDGFRRYRRLVIYGRKGEDVDLCRQPRPKQRAFFYLRLKTYPSACAVNYRFANRKTKTYAAFFFVDFFKRQKDPLPVSGRNAAARILDEILRNPLPCISTRWKRKCQQSL